MRIHTLPAVLLLALPSCVLGHSSEKLELRDLTTQPARRVAILPFVGVDSYPSTSATATSGAVLLAVTQSTTVARRRLWVLIDDATGTVVDSEFRED